MTLAKGLTGQEAWQAGAKGPGRSRWPVRCGWPGSLGVLKTFELPGPQARLPNFQYIYIYIYILVVVVVVVVVGLDILSDEVEVGVLGAWQGAALRHGANNCTTN